MLAHKVTRRFFLQVAGAGSAVAAAACAPAAAPIAAPLDSATGAAAGWQQEWDRLVAAAREEGQLVVVTLAGLTQRKVLNAFQETFPGLTVAHHQFTSLTELVPKAGREREAGIYTFDVGSTSVGPVLRQMRPAGMVDPIRPLFFRPDITGDDNWLRGFDGGWMDRDQKWVYSGGTGLSGTIWINTEMVREEEVRTVDDLVNPKWKGAILFPDVRTGFAYFPMAALRVNRPRDGDDLVRKLLVDQAPAFLREDRQKAEAMVRGRFAIAIHLNRSLVDEYKKQGLGRALKEIAVPEFLQETGGTSMYVFNRAPHPSAAKLFINWSFSTEGQRAWCTSSDPPTNSRRKDLPVFDPASYPEPGKRYFTPSHEDTYVVVEDTQKWIAGLVGMKDVG